MQGMCLQQKFISGLEVHGNYVLNQQNVEKCAQVQPDESVWRMWEYQQTINSKYTRQHGVWKTQFLQYRRIKSQWTAIQLKSVK